MCNAWNHSHNCKCGWGGEGHLGSGGHRTTSSFVSAKSSSRIYTHSGQSYTYPRKCWWCGQEVYFHSNGYGDFVMFNELGHPWEVHKCWQERQVWQVTIEPYDEIVASITEAINYKPSKNNRVYAPQDENNQKICVNGIVVDNHLYSSNPVVTKLSAGRYYRPSSLFTIEIMVGEESYHFLLPRSKTVHIRRGDMVKVTGQWAKWNGQWIVLPSTISKLFYPSSCHSELRVFDLEDILRCYYCKGVIKGRVKWGVDNFLRIKCETCSTKLDRPTPK